MRPTAVADARDAFVNCPSCQEVAGQRLKEWRGAYVRLVSSIDLGHDRTGHHAYNTLLRSGLDSRDAVEELTDADLARLPRLWKAGAARIRAAIPAPIRHTGAARAAARALREGVGCVVGEYSPVPPRLRPVIVAALREAAAEYAQAARLSADAPGELAQLPSPTAEAVLAAARLAFGPQDNYPALPAGLGDKETPS